MVPYGKTIVYVTTANGHERVADFIVVRDDLAPLIGRKTAELMRLVTVNYSLDANVGEAGAGDATDHIIEKYCNVFGRSLGSLPGLVHLATKPTASPEQ